MANDWSIAVSVKVHNGNDLVRQYLIGETLAPNTYDGFDTLTLENMGSGKRLVLVEVNNVLWQSQRYESGGYGLNQLQDANVAAHAARELLRRLKNASD